MTSAESRLLARRLRNQRVAGSGLPTPAAVVGWLGAVQAQDYPAARWAVGQRTTSPSDDAVQDACDRGEILRTHVLRPTWHFVTSADVRWMLELTAPRVKALCVYQHRQMGLTARTFVRSQAAIARALESGRHLTRKEVAAVLGRAGIAASGVALGHVMLQAELDAVVCSGPRRDRQQTYALLADRVPQARTLARDEALAELARRYFQSHGPALAGDFAWWSGLTVRDAKAGIAMAAPALDRLVLDGREYWHVDGGATARRPAAAYLLANFDEYTVAYRERALIVPPPGRGVAALSAMDALGNVIVIDGRIAATWRRSSGPGTVPIDVRPYRPLTVAEMRLIARAAERYGRFLGTPVSLALAPA
jgi:hypothetical protein